MAEWQPIETAPKDGRIVLLADRKGRRFLSYWEQKWSWSKFRVVRQWNTVWAEGAFEAGEESGEVDFWWPLPAPPVIEGSVPGQDR